MKAAIWGHLSQRDGYSKRRSLSKRHFTRCLSAVRRTVGRGAAWLVLQKREREVRRASGVRNEDSFVIEIAKTASSGRILREA